MRQDSLDLLGLEAIPEPGRHAYRRMLRRAAGGEGVGHRRVQDRDLRLRQIGHCAQALDHLVQRGSFLGAHDLRAGGAEGELVRRVVLEERDPDHDHEHRDEPHVQVVEEDDGEQDVEQTQEAGREEHAEGQAGITAI